MRDEWNEELRRAYDRGYWDARREYEHHLRTSHSDGERRNSESYSGGTNRGSDERSRYSGGQSTSDYRQSSGRGSERGSYGSQERSSRGGETQGYSSRSSRDEGYFDPRAERNFGMKLGDGRHASRDYDRRYDSGNHSSNRDRYGDYPPGDSRTRFEQRDEDERYGGNSRGSDSNRDRRDNDRGFFERAGDEISSWFDRDDRNSSGLSRGFDRGVTGR